MNAPTPLRQVAKPLPSVRQRAAQPLRRAAVDRRGSARAHGRDESGVSADAADAVVFARSTEDVAALVELARCTACR